MSLSENNVDVDKLITENVSYLKNKLIEFSNNEDEHIRKKSVLIAYWIKSYADLLSDENTFNTKKLPKYTRGSILSVDFGFRIGNELGGRHFAIVIDNHNDIKSNVITVLPMTSKKENTKIGRYNYELKNDLTLLYKEKFDKLLEKNLQKIKDLKEKMILLTNDTNQIENTSQSDIDKIMVEYKKIYTSIQNLESFKFKMSQLKNGSIVNISQITTISKQRILNPKQSSDALSGIRVKQDDLDEINEKLEKLFIFKKN